jgi:hypothetical protein
LLKQQNIATGSGGKQYHNKGKEAGKTILKEEQRDELKQARNYRKETK